MEVLVRKHPRYGYRRIGDLLRREGFRANPGRIYRLWKREGYRVARAQHKRRRLGASENVSHRHRPERRNHIWALDFIFDRDQGGRSLKWLSVLDEYTRECPKLLCERSITAADVIDGLIRIMQGRGAPTHIRADNGPEFIAQAVRTWLGKAGIGTLFVEPGAPWENGYAEPRTSSRPGWLPFRSGLRPSLLGSHHHHDPETLIAGGTESGGIPNAKLPLAAHFWIISSENALASPTLEVVVDRLF